MCCNKFGLTMDTTLMRNMEAPKFHVPTPLTSPSSARANLIIHHTVEPFHLTRVTNPSPHALSFSLLRRTSPENSPLSPRPSVPLSPNSASSFPADWPAYWICCLWSDVEMFFEVYLLWMGCDWRTIVEIGDFRALNVSDLWKLEVDVLCRLMI